MKQGQGHEHGRGSTRTDTLTFTVTDAGNDYKQWHTPSFGRIRTLTTTRHERENRHSHRHCVMTLSQRVCAGVDVDTS